VNHGRAEELFLMQPDLVLAGTWTTRATVNLLRRLGFEVAEFAPATSFDDIRANIRRMGRLLGREARAEALVAELDARLEAAKPAPGSAPPRAALRDAGSLTSGVGTLANAIVEAAGLGSIAAELGLKGMARLPLETLVMAAPDMLITSGRYEGRSLAEASLDHPALRRVAAGVGGTATSDARWVCGGPFTAAAVAELAEARDRLVEGAPR
ncbi:MAG TPA: ABC transporter substrate-binding protein, partial [Paracoccaceae bacterium]|nr:ABC transporter substrate-binding protein [Paracoccaceae bacterium]